MALFRRKQEDDGPALDLPGLSRAENKAFMTQLAAALDARGGGWDVTGDTLRLDGIAKEYGLASVARAWQDCNPVGRRGLLFDRLAVIDEQREAPGDTSFGAPRYDSGPPPRYDSGPPPRYDTGPPPRYDTEPPPRYDAGSPDAPHPTARFATGLPPDVAPDLPEPPRRGPRYETGPPRSNTPTGPPPRAPSPPPRYEPGPPPGMAPADMPPRPAPRQHSGPPPGMAPADMPPRPAPRQHSGPPPGMAPADMPPRPAPRHDSGPPPGMAPADIPALVRPQLWAMADFEALGADLVAREVADDLAVVLSLDLPAAVQVVPPEDVAGTGLSEGDLWERALARLDDGEPIERTPLDGDEQVEVLVSDSHFLATRLLALEELVGRLPAHGALVAVPHRHMLLVHAIRDERVLDAAHLMAPFTVEQFEEGPGSLSPHLYWWHGGELERLVVDDDEGSITPPDGFVALLETLTRE